jgi:hypothetical protein
MNENSVNFPICHGYNLFFSSINLVFLRILVYKSRNQIYSILKQEILRSELSILTHPSERVFIESVDGIYNYDKGSS